MIQTTFSPFGRYARISRPKLHNMPGRHEGVLLPDGRVAHTSAGRFPEIVQYHEFAAELAVQLEHELPTSENQRTTERLIGLMRSRPLYDPIFGNCESFARKVMGEPGVSWQIVVAGAMAWGLFQLAQA